jgi:hypothetical protein
MSLVAQPAKLLSSLEVFSVAVRIIDINGNLVPTAAQMVNVSSTASNITGTVSVMPVNGLATFVQLAIIETGVIKLIFACANITTVESDNFEVINGRLRNIEYNSQPEAAFCGVPWPLQPSVTIFDVGGNIFVRSVIVTANVYSSSYN